MRVYNAMMLIKAGIAMDGPQLGLAAMKLAIRYGIIETKTSIRKQENSNINQAIDCQIF